MTPGVRPLIAGNWKMHGLAADGLALARAVAAGAAGLAAEILVCPPATLVMAVAAAVQGGPVAVGGQDCHLVAKGAHTGDVSAPMLADAGARYVILGHSERRADHGETDALVRRKAEAAWNEGLVAIICIGETQTERDAGQALDVVGRQLAGSVPDGATAANTVVAYEPVWAIGTGRTPTVAEVAEVHDFMRKTLTGRFAGEAAGIRLLYGGSVKPSNAAELMAVSNVNGALVGGASLKAADFLAIAAGCP